VKHTSRKPKKCPECGSGSIAEILYGLPAYDEQMEGDLDAGKIVLGGYLEPGFLYQVAGTK